MECIPIRQQLLGIYGWVSMSTYLYLLYKITQWRRKISQFQSSYYTLFFLQAVADFYVFFVLEFIMRPRKFNYFHVFSKEMQFYAAFSYGNLMVSKVILCCGHICIALNRFTSFYFPFTTEKIWNNRTAILSVMYLWALSILTTLPVLLFYANSPRFVSTTCGVFLLKAPSLEQYANLHSSIANLVTVMVCSVCYLCCYIKNRHGKYRYKSVERRLFLCGLASSLPFCVEMVRSLGIVITCNGDITLYGFLTECWFYGTEILVTSSMWTQLIIDKNVRNRLLTSIRLKRSNTTFAVATTS